MFDIDEPISDYQKAIRGRLINELCLTCWPFGQINTVHITSCKLIESLKNHAGLLFISEQHVVVLF